MPVVLSVQKIIRDYSPLRDDAISVKATNVADSLTGNAFFPTPDPSVATLYTATLSYNAALAKADNGTPADTIDKDMKRRIVLNILAELAGYVEDTAEDNLFALASSGFDLSKIPAKIGVLPKPLNFEVLPGANKGSIELKVKAVPKASFYEFQFAEIAPPAIAVNGAELAWQTRTGSKRTMIIEGLTSGREYAFRVAAAGSDPARVWTDIQTSFVL